MSKYINIVTTLNWKWKVYKISEYMYMYRHTCKDINGYRVTIRQNEKAELIIGAEEWNKDKGYVCWTKYENWGQKNPTMTKAFKEDFMNKIEILSFKPILSRWEILDLREYQIK